jgi:hypothetical protein
MVPPLIEPLATAVTPCHISTAIPPNTSMMTIAVMIERIIDAPLGRAEGALHRLPETGRFAHFLPECLHDLHRAQHFADLHADVGHAVLARARGRAQPRSEIDDWPDDDRNAREQPCGQRRASVKRIDEPAQRR